MHPAAQHLLHMLLLLMWLRNTYIKLNQTCRLLAFTA
jgi:hypothetical protein